MKITIAIGADHRGYPLKQVLIKHPDLTHIEWIDEGTENCDRTDYPIYAQRVCADIVEKRASLGILLCGTGTGMAIAANRFKGIYAGVAWTEHIARLNREDDHCNILIIPSDYVSDEQAILMVKVWLAVAGKSGRYVERLQMIDSW